MTPTRSRTFYSFTLTRVGLSGLTEAIVRWVEEGRAPDKLIAERRDSSGKAIQTRPLFLFPQVARYKGGGNTNEAASFVSRMP